MNRSEKCAFLLIKKSYIAELLAGSHVKLALFSFIGHGKVFDRIQNDEKITYFNYGL